jgi:hypothetical protein
MHFDCWALDLAFERAGRSMPARIAMIAITTRSSISVKPEFRGFVVQDCGDFPTFGSMCIKMAKGAAKRVRFESRSGDDIENSPLRSEQCFFT